MALASFFDRVYSAIGGHLSVGHDDLASSLRDVRVGVVCGAAMTENEWWIAEFATNLLARLYPRLFVHAAHNQSEHLRRLAGRINPMIEFCDTAPAELTIGVGQTTSAAGIWPSAKGWISRLAFAPTSASGPANPYAAGAAACFATAEVFRRVFLGRHSDKEVSVSLLTFKPSGGDDMSLTPGNFGEVLLAGIGAVANSALWALARDGGRGGRMILVDPEHIEKSNLQRYVLGLLKDAEHAKPKTLIAARELRFSRIETEKVPLSLEEYADRHGGINCPTICVSVDNVRARRAAQALLPKLIVNGWTGDLALGASWHLFSDDKACLACLYHPHGPSLSQTEQAARALGIAPERAAVLWVTRTPLSELDISTAAQKLGVDPAALANWRGRPLGELYTDVVCGAAPIRLPVANRVETVPLAHQSALAGILMAAELVKRCDAELAAQSQCETLVTWADVLNSPPAVWTVPRAKELGCICSDAAYQDAFRQKWFSTEGH